MERGAVGGCAAAAMQLSTNRKIERGSDELPSGQWQGGLDPSSVVRCHCVIRVNQRGVICLGTDS